MSYEIRLRLAAQNKLDNLADKYFKTVAAMVDNLIEDPRPTVHKLSDSGLWRIRVGLYRLVCAIDYDAQLVTILSVTQGKKDI
jgi:mRNA-degrading endonuclease RelE of RelBE toxin-antitoxin system